MAIHQMLMYSKLRVRLSNTIGYVTNASPASATSTFELNSSGVLLVDGVAVTGQWLVTGASGDYDAFITVTSGTLTSGTSGAWLNLGTTRTFTRNRLGVGSNTVVFTVDIRDAVTFAPLATATVSLTAEVV